MTQNQTAYLESLNDDQLVRLQCQIYERYTAGSGYQPWGYDMETFRVLCPHLHAIYRYILSLLTPKAA